MILLTEVSEIEEFYRIKTLFESKGIAAYFGNQESARNFGMLHPAGKYAIHIMLDEQLADAKKLLLDPNHVVQNPVDLSEFDDESNKQVANKKIISVMLLILLAIVASVFLVFYIIN